MDTILSTFNNPYKFYTPTKPKILIERFETSNFVNNAVPIDKAEADYIGLVYGGVRHGLGLIPKHNFNANINYLYSTRCHKNKCYVQYTYLIRDNIITILCPNIMGYLVEYIPGHYTRFNNFIYKNKQLLYNTLADGYTIRIGFILYSENGEEANYYVEDISWVDRELSIAIKREV